MKISEEKLKTLLREAIYKRKRTLFEEITLGLDNISLPKNFGSAGGDFINNPPVEEIDRMVDASEYGNQFSAEIVKNAIFLVDEETREVASFESGDRLDTNIFSALKSEIEEISGGQFTMDTIPEDGSPESFNAYFLLSNFMPESEIKIAQIQSIFESAISNTSYGTGDSPIYPAESKSEPGTIIFVNSITGADYIFESSESADKFIASIKSPEVDELSGQFDKAGDDLGLGFSVMFKMRQ